MEEESGANNPLFVPGEHMRHVSTALLTPYLFRHDEEDQSKECNSDPRKRRETNKTESKRG